MKSCPNINSPEHKELVKVFGKETAIALYHLNNESTPSLLKGYKILNKAPDKNTIYTKRQQGIGRLRNHIDTFSKGIPEKSLQFAKDEIERYGFENMIYIEKRHGKYFLRNKEGSTLTKDDLFVVDEERELNNKVNDLTKTMFESYSNIMKKNSNPATIKTSTNRYLKFRKELNKSPNSALNVINLYKKIIGDEKKQLNSDEIAFIVSQYSTIVAYSSLIKEAKETGIYDNVLNRTSPRNKHLSDETKNLIVVSEILSDFINDTSKDSTINWTKDKLNIADYNLEDISNALNQTKIPLNKEMQNSLYILLFRIKQGLASLENSNIDEVANSILNEHSPELNSLSKESNRIKKEVNRVLAEDNKLGDIDATLNRRKLMLQKMYAIQTNLKKVEQRKLSPDNQLVRRLHGRIKAIEEGTASLWNTNLDRINYLATVHKILHMDVIKDFNNLLKDINERDFTNSSTQSSAHILLRAKDLIEDYGELVSLIRQELNYIANEYVEKGITDKVFSELETIVSEIDSKIKELSTVTTKETYSLLHNFFSAFMPEGGQIRFGDKQYNLDQILNLAEEDIGFIDRWLQSIKDSNNSFLRLLDQPIKFAKRNVYNRSLEVMKDIQDAHDELMKSGVKDTKFMYEMIDKDTPTGYFKRKYNDKYETELRNYYKKERRKNLDKPGSEIYEEFRKKHGYYKDGVYFPNSVYLSDDYVSMNDAQKKYYDFILGLKEELEKKMPFKMRGAYLAPQVRKEFFERMRSGNFTENMKQYFKDLYSESQHDDTVIRESEVESKKRQTIPIRYNTLFDNPTDMSLDASGSMIAFANMAINFEEMNSIVDTMELLREHISEKRIKSDSITVSKGRIVQQIDVTESELFKRVNDFYESALYGKEFADQGTIGKSNVNKRKLANLAIKGTVLNTLAFNALAGMANIFTGLHNARIEAVGSQFFNYKDYLSSIKEYMSYIPSMIADFEAQRNSSFINLVNEYFQITQGIEEQFRHMDIYKKSKIFRMLNPRQAFILMNGGEHMLGMITGMAFLKSHNVLDANGKKVSLFSQLKKDGYRLTIPEGTRNLDGSLFTDNDRASIQIKIREISERLNGIYNSEDKAAAQRTWQGSLIFLYRRYLIPNLNNRFGRSNYSFALGAETKGYHRVITDFFIGLAKNRKDMIAFSKDYWGDMSDIDRMNLKKSVTEVGYILAMMAIYNLLSAVGTGTDKDDPYYERMLLYQVRRQMTEIGALSIVVPFNVNEALTLLNSPTAALDYVSKTSDLFKVLFYPSEANHIMQSGPYKGMRRWQKNLIEISPYYKMLLRNKTPEINIKYLDMDK